MKNKIKFALLGSIIFLNSQVFAKEKITALYIPLADHYPGIIAFEKYKDQMKHADFEIQPMESWPALEGKFTAKQADLAFILSPLAMDMYAKDQNIKWISLIHRDGNAMAMNGVLEGLLKNKLSDKLSGRKPGKGTADAYVAALEKFKSPTAVGVPSLKSTHAVVMYKFLKDHGQTLNITAENPKNVATAKAVPPPKSPSFIKAQSDSGIPSSFVQSFPWGSIVEEGKFGKIGWYSKDVIPSDKGHVDCIIISHKDVIDKKREAVKETVYYIHKAGQDIEDAMKEGGDKLNGIVDMIRKHIPLHTKEAIIASLNAELKVINYKNLNVDEAGLKVIKDLAVESGVLTKDVGDKVDISKFADHTFNIDLSKK